MRSDGLHSLLFGMSATRIPRPDSPSRDRRRLRVLVVDDHPLTRAGVAALLNQAPGLRVCGQAGSVGEALSTARRMRPDLVLTDLEMGPRSGLELVRRLHADQPRMPVIVFSMHYESLYAERALRAGATGYVMKSEGPARLIEAVRDALAGVKRFDASIPEGGAVRARRGSGAACAGRRPPPSSSS